jgi:hypothetical protein
MGTTAGENLLIVEGHDDKHCVISLMEHHVTWPDGPENAPVKVAVGFSVEQILHEPFLRVYLKSNPVRRLGIVLDADDNLAGRFQSLRAICLPYFPDMPESLEASGLIVSNADGKRLGAWFMPDNISAGCLEMFLEKLVPAGNLELWHYAVEVVDQAIARGAPLKGSDVQKARVYSYLAWYEPPGRAPGLALKQHVFNPWSPAADLFISWFRSLYQL